jgi:hypothetical protein
MHVDTGNGPSVCHRSAGCRQEQRNQRIRLQKARGRRREGADATDPAENGTSNVSSKKYPYSIQLTAHGRNTVGSIHKATISIARDGKAYVWADGQFTRFTIDPPPEVAIVEQPLLLVIQAIAMAMRLR